MLPKYVRFLMCNVSITVVDTAKVCKIAHVCMVDIAIPFILLANVTDQGRLFYGLRNMIFILSLANIVLKHYLLCALASMVAQKGHSIP